MVAAVKQNWKIVGRVSLDGLNRSVGIEAYTLDNRMQLQPLSARLDINPKRRREIVILAIIHPS